ncbi:MAG: DUF4097 domain-containing protein [Lachnospiraceae bacterium]|nr:DUF4097 domain-containing protein [Lachnospiraceae bacterium]
MKNNIKIGLAMAIFLMAVFVFCIFMIMYMPRGSFYIGGANAALRHTTNIRITEKTSLDVSAFSENIYFLKSDTDELIIKEYYRNKNKKADLRHSDQTVTIRGEQQINISILGFVAGERIEIYLPENYAGNIKASISSGNIKSDFNFMAQQLSFEANSGSISLNSLTAGNINVRASSGTIRIIELIGDAEIRANSGSIVIDRIDGFLDVNASSGTVRIANLSGGIKVQSNSGSIRISVKELDGNISATASSGSINIELPKDSAFNFSANTGSGRVRTDFDSSLSYNSRGNSANGTVGTAPEYDVIVKANSGSVRVTR